MDVIGVMLACILLGGFFGYAVGWVQTFSALDRRERRIDWLATEAAAWHDRYDEAMALLAARTQPEIERTDP